MAQRTRTGLKTLYGAAGTEFPDNTTRLITEEKMRNQGEDLADSEFNLLTDAFSGAQGLRPNIDEIADLKAIVTVGMPLEVVVIFRDAVSSGILRVYQLTSGTSPESSPTTIRPNDYNGVANAKIWRLAQVTSSGLESVVVDTTGGTITLDLNDLTQRMFVGSASIGAAKTWALDNDASALAIPSVKFTMTTDDVQTFPANFKMASFVGNWDSATQEWFTEDPGDFIMTASFDGTSWFMTITGPF